MSSIAVAVIAGVFSIAVVLVSTFGAHLHRDLDACLRERDACLHERRQLKQVLQLTVGALVGLLEPAKRDELLVRVSEAIDLDGET